MALQLIPQLPVRGGFRSACYSQAYGIDDVHDVVRLGAGMSLGSFHPTQQGANGD